MGDNMTDGELLKLLQGMRDRCDKQMQDLLKLQDASVDLQAEDGRTLDDMIQQEFDATQRLERTMASIRSRTS